MADSKIKVRIRAIPDGFVKRKKKTFCRFSLICLPDKSTGNDVDAPIVDLANWPEEIAQIAPQLVLRHAILRRGDKPDLSKEKKLQELSFHSPLIHQKDGKWTANNEAVAAAMSLWREIFAGLKPKGDQDKFAFAAETLRKGQVADVHEIMKDSGRKGPNVLSYSPVRLSAALDSLHGATNLARIFAVENSRKESGYSFLEPTTGPGLFSRQLHERMFGIRVAGTREAAAGPDAHSESERDELKAAGARQPDSITLSALWNEGIPADEAPDFFIRKDQKEPPYSPSPTPLRKKFFKAVELTRELHEVHADNIFENATTHFERITFDNLGTAEKKDDESEESLRTSVLGDGDWLFPNPDVKAAGLPNNQYSIEHLEMSFASRARKPEFWSGGAEKSSPEPDRFRPMGDKLGDDEFSVLYHEYTAFRMSWRDDNAAPTVSLFAADDKCAAEAVERRLAGIFAYPSLAKFLGMIVDVEADAEALKNSAFQITEGTAVSTYGLVGASRAGTDLPAEWTVFKRMTPKDQPLEPFLEDEEPGEAHAGPAGDLKKPSDLPPPFFGTCSSFEVLDAINGRFPDPKHPERSYAKYPYYNGLLNLGLKLGNGEPRFIIETMNVAAAARAAENASQDTKTREAGGELAERIDGTMEGQRTAGVALIDRNRATETSATLARAQLLAKEVEGGGRPVLAAEDLVTGYRLSVGVQGASGVQWRTLHARKLVIPNIPSEFEPATKEEKQRERQRNFGHIKTGGRVAVKTDKSGNPTNEAVIPQTVAIWKNWSLSLPAPGTPDAPICSEDDLPIDVEMGMIENAPWFESLMPMRFKRRYRLLTEAVYQNGGGIGLVDSVQLVRSSGKLALPELSSGPEGGHAFLRHEQILAPSVHLAELIGNPKKPNSNFGEQLEHLVVRTGDKGHGPETKRFLAPPKATFELCELHGAFDRFADKNRPEGAMIEFDLCSETGMVPVVGKDGQPTCAGVDAATRYQTLKSEIERTQAGRPRSDWDDKSRGDTLLKVEVIPGKHREFPWMPDPLAERVMAAVSAPFAKEGSVPSPISVPFYVGNAPWPEAKPILVEVEPVTSVPGGRICSISAGTKYHDKVQVPHLLIKLAQGETIDLKLWSLPKSIDGLEAHAASRTIARTLLLHQKSTGAQERMQLRGEVGTNLVGATENLKDHYDLVANKAERTARTRIWNALQLAPLPLVNEVTTVRIVHALQRPPKGLPKFLRPLLKEDCGPDFQLDGPDDGADCCALKPPMVGTLQVVRINEGQVTPPTEAGEAQTEKPDPWAAYVAANQGNTIDTWKSEAGASTAYFAGKILFDRKTTSRIDCIASWDEYDDHPMTGGLRRNENGEFEFKPQRRFEGWHVDKIREVGSDGDILDVLRDEADKLRGLHIKFDGPKARCVQLTLRATSRFQPYFDPATKTSSEALSAADPKPDGPFETSTVVKRFWIDSTAHPSPPDPAYHWVSWDWKTEEGKRDVRIKGTLQKRDFVRKIRIPYFRIYLNQPWWSAGEGELLGLVLWPPTLFSVGEPPVGNPHGTVLCAPFGSDFETKHGDKAEILDAQLEPWISRWGADPTKESIGPEFFIRDEAVSLDVRAWRNSYQMPLPGPKPDIEGFVRGSRDQQQDPTVYRNVAVAAFETKLDPDSGLRYADIGLHTFSDYFPIVRLSLVRLQPHSLAGYELSEPVKREVPMVPQRTTTLTYLDEHTIEVEVTGTGYTDAYVDPLQSSEEQRRMRTPQLTICLMEPLPGPWDTRIPRLAGSKEPFEPFEETRPGKVVMEYTDAHLDTDGAKLTWTKQIRLPTGKKKLMVLVEEKEILANAAGRNMESKMPPSKPTQSRATYLCTIPVRD